MHSELGWLYPSPSMDAGVWFWKDGLKWLWTDSERFPFLHSIEEDSWLYFYGNLEQKRLFFVYRTQKWIVLNNGVVEENTTSSTQADNPNLQDDPDKQSDPDQIDQQVSSPTGDLK